MAYATWFTKAEIVAILTTAKKRFVTLRKRFYFWRNHEHTRPEQN